jgi:hypothetical protein
LLVAFGSFGPQCSLQLEGEVSLPVHAGWSELLLFSPGGSCIALQLQLCLVSSSPSQVGQFSFEHSPLSHEISSRIHYLPCFGKVAPLSLSTFVLLLTSVFSSGRLACHPTLPSSGQVQCSTRTSTVGVRLYVCFLCYSVSCGIEEVQSQSQGLCWICS